MKEVRKGGGCGIDERGGRKEAKKQGMEIRRLRRKKRKEGMK